MKRICSIILVTLALAVLSAATYSFSCSMRAYAEELSSFVVGINHSSGGTLQVIDADGNSSTINRGDAVTVQQGDNLVIRAIPDSCFGVTSIKINDEEVTPATTFTLNNITNDCSIYVEFRLTDIDKLMEYSSYYYLSEYNNMSSLAEDQILRAVCSYSDEDINGMVAREVFKKCFDIVWQDIIAAFTDRPSYEEEQIDKLTDTFVENYYNELVKDDNFTQVVDLNAYVLPFSKAFKEVKSWSSISKDEFVALRGEWIYNAFKNENPPLDYNIAYEVAKNELSDLYRDWDKYLGYFDSAYSFQEFVVQTIMLREIDRQIIEDLYNATDESTVLHTGLKRRLDRIDSSDVSLMVKYAIDEGLISKMGSMTKKFTFGMLGATGNTCGIIYAAISSGIKLYEKLYDVASVGDYVIACYACDAQSYFSQQIEAFIADRKTDTKKLELLIRAHSAAAKTAVSKGENAISKLYNGSLTDENKLKEKEEIEYKFALYKPWVNSSACSYTTFINQWIDYAEACESGAPKSYIPQSVYTADIYATGDVSIENHSLTIEGNPNVKFYSNIRLNIELADDAALEVSDNYVADVSISKLKLNSHTLDVTGSVSVGGMTLDAGTLNFNNEPLIKGLLYTGDNTNLVFNGGVTIKGGLNATKGTTTINGNVKHTGGVFSPNNIVINGNYYGYSEDENGNKLPGGYISMIGNISDKLLINGDCYLNNSIYSNYSGTSSNGIILSAEYSWLKRGTLELKGNLINLNDNRVGMGKGTRDSNSDTVQFTVLFSGDRIQKVISTNGGGFDFRTINVQCAGLDVSEARDVTFILESDVTIYGNSFDGYIFSRNNNTVTFADPVTIKGTITAASQFTAESDLILNGNLVSKEFVVNGDFKHESGLIEDFNNGTINGNYYGYSEDENGNKLPGGYISMIGNISDKLLINGDCYLNNSIYSNYSGTSSNAAYVRFNTGTIELKGDLINLNSKKVGMKYYKTANFTVIFSGDEIQKVTSINGGGFDFGNVSISSLGVDFSNANANIKLDSDNYYIRRNSANVIVFVAPKSLNYSASVAGHSLILTDGIGVKFLMDLSDSIVNDETAVMKFTVNGKEIIIPVKDVQPEISSDQTVYSFTCNVAAAEMTDVISAQLCLGAYDSDVFTYSVQAYSQYILDNSEDYSEYIPVVKAMLNYGAEAQKYFNHNTENLANSILSEDDLDIPVVNASKLYPYKYAITDSDAVIDFVGCVISLKSGITTKLYFSGKDFTVDDFTVLAGEEAIDPSRLSIGRDDNGVYLAISDIMAGDFDQSFTVTVGSVSICNLSVYSYLQQSLANNRAEQYGIVFALYSFNEAVETIAA